MAITRVTGNPNAVLAHKIISYYLPVVPESYELFWKEFESHQRWLLPVSNVCLTGTSLSFPAFPCVRLVKSTEVTDRTNTATKFHPLSLFSSRGHQIETQDCLPRRVNS